MDPSTTGFTSVAPSSAPSGPSNTVDTRMFPIASAFISQSRLQQLFESYFFVDFYSRVQPAVEAASIAVMNVFNVTFSDPCDRDSHDSSVYANFGFVKRPQASNVQFQLDNSSVALTVLNNAIVNLSGIVVGNVATSAEAFVTEGTCVTQCVCDGETFWICRPDSSSTLHVSFPFTLQIELVPDLRTGMLQLQPTTFIPDDATVSLACDALRNGSQLPPFVSGFNQTFISAAEAALRNFIDPVRNVIHDTLVEFTAFAEQVGEARRTQPLVSPSGMNTTYGYWQALTQNTTLPFSLVLILNASFWIANSEGAPVPVPLSPCDESLLPDPNFNDPTMSAAVRVSSAFLQATVTAAYVNGSFSMYNLHHVLDATIKLNLTVVCPVVYIRDNAIVLELPFGNANATCVSCVTNHTLEVLLASMNAVLVDVEVLEYPQNGTSANMVYRIMRYNFSSAVFDVIHPNGGFPQKFLTSLIEKGLNESSHMVDHALRENGFGLPYQALCLLGNSSAAAARGGEQTLSIHTDPSYSCTSEQGYLQVANTGENPVPTPPPSGAPPTPPANSSAALIMDLFVFDGHACDASVNSMNVHRVGFEFYCAQLAVVDNVVYYYNVTSVVYGPLAWHGPKSSIGQSTGYFPISGKFFCDSSCSNCAWEGNMTSAMRSCTQVVLPSSSSSAFPHAFFWSLSVTPETILNESLGLCRPPGTNGSSDMELSFRTGAIYEGDYTSNSSVVYLTSTTPSCGGTHFVSSSPIAVPNTTDGVSCAVSFSQGLLSLNASSFLFFDCGTKCPANTGIQNLVCDSSADIAPALSDLGGMCISATSSLGESNVLVATADRLSPCTFWTSLASPSSNVIDHGGDQGRDSDARYALILLVLLAAPVFYALHKNRRACNESVRRARDWAFGHAIAYHADLLSRNTLPPKLILLFAVSSIYFGLAAASLTKFMFAGYSTSQFHDHGVPSIVSIDGLSSALEDWRALLRYTEIGWATIYLLLVLPMVSMGSVVPSTRIAQVLVFGHVVSIIFVMVFPPIFMDVSTFAKVKPLGAPGTLAGGHDVTSNLDRVTSAISFFTLLPAILQVLLVCSSACPLSACVASLLGEYYLSDGTWRLNERHIRRMVLMTCWAIFPVSMGLSVCMFYQQTRDGASFFFWLLQIIGVTVGSVMLTLYHEVVASPRKLLILLVVADVLCVACGGLFASSPYGGTLGDVTFLLVIHFVFGLAMTGCQLFWQFDVAATASWLSLRFSVSVETQDAAPESVGAMLHTAKRAAIAFARFMAQEVELRDVSRYRRRLWYRRIVTMIITAFILALVALSSTTPPTTESVRDWSISLLEKQGFAFPKNHSDIHLAWDPGLLEVANVKFDRRGFFYCAAIFCIAGMLASFGCCRMFRTLQTALERRRKSRHDSLGGERQRLFSVAAGTSTTDHHGTLTLADALRVAAERASSLDALELTFSKLMFAACFFCMILATFYVDMPNYVEASHLERDIPRCGVEFYDAFSWILRQVTGMFFGLLVSGGMFPLLLALPATAIRVEFQVSNAVSLEHCNASFMALVSFMSPIINLVPILLVSHLDGSESTRNICVSTLVTPLVLSVAFRLFRVRSLLGIHTSLIWMMVYVLHWVALVVLEAHRYPVVWEAIQHLVKHPTFYFEIFTDIFLSTVLLSDFLMFLMEDDDRDCRFEWAVPASIKNRGYDESTTSLGDMSCSVNSKAAAAASVESLCFAVAVVKSALLMRDPLRPTGDLARRMLAASKPPPPAAQNASTLLNGEEVILVDQSRILFPLAHERRAAIRALRDCMFYGEHIDLLQQLLVLAPQQGQQHHRHNLPQEGEVLSSAAVGGGGAFPPNSTARMSELNDDDFLSHQWWIERVLTLIEECEVDTRRGFRIVVIDRRADKDTEAVIQTTERCEPAYGREDDVLAAIFNRQQSKPAAAAPLLSVPRTVGDACLQALVRRQDEWLQVATQRGGFGCQLLDIPVAEALASATLLLLRCDPGVVIENLPTAAGVSSTWQSLRGDDDSRRD